MPGTSVGGISLDLGLNDKKYKKEVKGLESATKKSFSGLASFFSNFFANVASNLLNKMLDSVKGFVQESISLASDLQEVENVVDTVFSHMEDQVDSFAASAMESFGLSELVAKRYMGQLGAMAKSFDYTEEEAYNLARSITGLTGDVASFYNMSTDEAFTKLKSIFTGETESLKELGIVMTQSALDSFAMSQGMEKTTSEMSESEKVALRYKFVLNQLSSAQGDFSKTSESWANQTRILGLEFDILKSTLGEGFIVALTPAIKMLNTFIIKLQEVAAGFTALIKHIMGVSSAETESVSTGADVAVESTGQVAENMNNTAQAAEKAKRSLLGFDEINKLSDPGEGKMPDASGTNAKGDIGLFDWGTSYLDKPLNDLSDKFIKTYEKIADTMASIYKSFKDKVDEMIKWTKSTFKPLYNQVKKYGESLADIFVDAWEGFSDKYLPNIIGNTGSFLRNIKQILGDTLDLVTSSVDIIGDSLKESGEDLATGLADILGGFSVLVTGILSVSSGVISSMLTVINSWVTQNKADIVEVLSDLYSFVASVMSLLGTVMNDVGTSLTTFWEGNFKPVFEGVISSLTKVWDILILLWETVIEPIIDNLMVRISELWDTSLHPFFENVMALGSALINLFVTLWKDVLAPVVEFFLTVFGPSISNSINFVVDFVSKLFENVFRFVNKMLEGITMALEGFTKFLSGVFTLDFQKIWDGIKDIFKGSLNNMITLFELFANLIIGGFNNLLASVVQIVVGTINRIIRAAKEVFSMFGVDTSGWKELVVPTIQLPSLDIPMLAEGGFVRANQPTLAVVGDNRREGEIIAPESKIAEAVARGIAQAMSMMQGGFGSESSQPIEVVVQIGDEVLIDRIINGINRENRRAGRVVIKT